MSERSPRKMKRSMTQSSASPTKRTLKTQGTLQVQRSTEFEARGLSSNEVELEHLRTIVQEIKRERAVTESLQRDNELLKENLRRSEDVRTKQEGHIGALEKVRIEQDSHIAVLVQENKALKAENASLLDDKENLQKEILTASDYIVALENKCYQANKTSLELL